MGLRCLLQNISDIMKTKEHSRVDREYVIKKSRVRLYYISCFPHVTCLGSALSSSVIFVGGGCQDGDTSVLHAVCPDSFQLEWDEGDDSALKETKRYLCSFIASTCVLCSA